MALPATIPAVAGRAKGFFVPASARQYSTLLSLLLVAPLLALLSFGFLYPVGRLIAGSSNGSVTMVMPRERSVSTVAPSVVTSESIR